MNALQNCRYQTDVFRYCFFQSAESLKKYADIWGVTPIIGDGSLGDDEYFPGVYMAFKTSGNRQASAKKVAECDGITLEQFCRHLLNPDADILETRKEHFTMSRQEVKEILEKQLKRLDRLSEQASNGITYVEQSDDMQKYTQSIIAIARTIQEMF